ncbi:MAG: GMC family oxidoreductase [Acidobacteria bacterium]|nr:GMC family oxidoreductase [Acidobacteriota bacterium]
MSESSPTRDFDTDVIIIGSGFGGSVAALRFSEKGYRVWVLEKGKRWRPEDFPATNWNIPKSFWLPWLGCYGTWALHLLRDVLVIHGVGVGGGSLLYANTHLEPADAVWDDPRWKGIEDWRAVMPPHFATARRMLGSVSCPQQGIGDEALRRIADRRGFGQTYHPADVGVFFGEPDVEVDDPYFDGQGPRRKGCTHCGACMIGCRIGAKNTLDKNYLYLAEKIGTRVVAETQVELIEPLAGGGYRVHWRKSTDRAFPDRGAFTARKVVLAGGVLGTVPLLMSCGRRGSLTQLSPELGAYTRTNSEALLGITSRTHGDLWKGLAIQAEVHVDSRTRMEMVRFPRGADVVLMLGTPLTDGGPGAPRQLRWAKTLLRHPLQTLRVMKPWGKAEKSEVLLVMQTNDNYTRLVQKRQVFWPFRPTLTSKPTPGQPHVPSFIPIANDVARELAAELDAVPQSTINEVLMDQSTTAHIMGGCAIGASRDQGVVDSKFEVFGYPGLYVMDGSVIGANLGANPSLTITALAEFACSRIPPRTT